MPLSQGIGPYRVQESSGKGKTTPVGGVIVLMALAEALKVPVPAAKDLLKPLVHSEFSPSTIALVAMNVSLNEVDLVQGDVDQASSGGPAILLLPDSRWEG